MTQLGFIDPVTVTTAISLGKSLSGILAGHPKDRERFAKNAEAYRSAVAGNQNSLEYLKYRSGRYDVAQHIGPPINDGPIGGWGSAAARDDAWKLYQAVLASYGIGVEELPDGAGNNSPTTGGAQGQGLPPVRVMGTQNFTPLLILGAGLAIVAAMSKQRGR